MLKKVIAGSLALISTYLIADAVIPDASYGLRINRSDSLPQTVFISGPMNGPIHKGDYVSCSHSYSPVKLAKMVVGVEGDTISFLGNEIYVSGKFCGDTNNRLLDCGIQLHPVKAQIIPPGYLYLHAPHPDSFDSRYEEFGLIATKDLEERLWPVF